MTKQYLPIPKSIEYNQFLPITAAAAVVFEALLSYVS